MMLADARLPVGAHAYSAGLEPALKAGMPVHSVPAYVQGRARTVSLIEAGTAVVSRHVALDSGADMLSRLSDVEAAWAARTPSRAVRETARELARGYGRLARRLWPSDVGVLAVTSGRLFSRPVVLGVIAAAAGIDPASLVRLVVYDDAQVVAAALLKLEPTDPLIPAAFVLDACSAAESQLASLAALTLPEAIPANGAPQSEEWAEAHSRTTQRLFRA